MRCVSLVFGILWSMGFASGGVVFHVQLTNHDGLGDVVERVLKVQDLSVKVSIVTLDGGDGEMIFRGDQERLLLVDHGTRSYLVIEAEQGGGRSLGEIAESERQIQEVLKGIPEAHRAAAEQMLREDSGQVRGPAAVSVEIKKTSERETINGYRCVRFDVLRNGERIREFWVTDWKNIEGAEEAKLAFEAMAKFAERLVSSKQLVSGIAAIVEESPAAVIGKLGGFPVRIRDLDDDSTETQLVSTQLEAQDLTEFEPPGDYLKQNPGSSTQASP